jgi:hypothetical protein
MKKPSKTYAPNGAREVTRRRAQIVKMSLRGKTFTGAPLDGSERKIYHVDIGDLSTEKAKSFVDKIKNSFENR